MTKYRQYHSSEHLQTKYLANALIKFCALHDMERAEEHYCGIGMGKGVHFGSTLAYLRSIKPSEFNIKSILEDVLAASSGTAERIHSINHK